MTRSAGPASQDEADPDRPDLLRGKYLDYCSARIADVLLRLTADEMYLLAQDAARELGRREEASLSYDAVVRLATQRLSSSISLPDFATWSLAYEEDPDRFERELLGLWEGDAAGIGPTVAPQGGDLLRRERGEVRLELQRSLDQGRFRLLYQPVMDLASGRITDFEALLRWDHPEHGLLPAIEFLSDAEDLDLILPIGRWVIREAVRELARWEDARRSSDPHVILGVNLSPGQLLDPRLPSWLRESLEDEEVEGSRLRVEIPEDFFARNAAEVESVLRPLRELGIRIGVDGFGGRRPALDYLEQIPVDLWKIDRELIAGLPVDGVVNDAEAAPIRAILELGERLGVQVVAAGVETSPQEAYLREISCRFAQGYLFSEPVEADRVPSLLASSDRMR